jgi:hypothetical protein
MIDKYLITLVVKVKAQCCKTDKDHAQRIPENIDNQPKLLKEDI